MSPEKAELLQWISEVIGEPVDTTDFGEALRDGVVLCKLMNKISPGSCAHVASKKPFIKMENINRFLQAARKIGVPDPDLFQSIDLFEKKDLRQVEICLYAVSRHAQKNNLFKGPFIGPRLADQRKYEFTAEQTRRSKAYMPMQAGYYVDLGEYVQNMGVRRQITDSIFKEKRDKKE